MANEVEKKIEEMQEVCDKLKFDIKDQEKLIADLVKLGRDNFDNFDRAISIMGKQKKLLYLITRITWDNKAMQKGLIKGKGLHKQTQEYPQLTLPFDEFFIVKNFVED